MTVTQRRSVRSSTSSRTQQTLLKSIAHPYRSDRISDSDDAVYGRPSRRERKKKQKKLYQERYPSMFKNSLVLQVPDRNPKEDSIVLFDTSIDTLPVEVLTLVFESLDPRSLARAASTCRSWHTIIEDDGIWHSSRIRHFPETSNHAAIIHFTERDFMSICYGVRCSICNVQVAQYQSTRSMIWSMIVCDRCRKKNFVKLCDARMMLHKEDIPLIYLSTIPRDSWRPVFCRDDILVAIEDALPYLDTDEWQSFLAEKQKSWQAVEKESVVLASMMPQVQLTMCKIDHGFQRTSSMLKALSLTRTAKTLQIPSDHMKLLESCTYLRPALVSAELRYPFTMSQMSHIMLHLPTALKQQYELKLNNLWIETATKQYIEIVKALIKQSRCIKPDELLPHGYEGPGAQESAQYQNTSTDELEESNSLPSDVDDNADEDFINIDLDDLLARGAARDKSEALNTYMLAELAAEAYHSTIFAQHVPIWRFFNWWALLELGHSGHSKVFSLDALIRFRCADCGKRFLCRKFPDADPIHLQSHPDSFNLRLPADLAMILTDTMKEGFKKEVVFTILDEPELN